MNKNIVLPAAAAAICFTVNVHAQKPQLPGNYPSKPVRLIVGFPPGGGSNTMARLVATRLSERWASNIIVDNRPGANGLIAIQTTANAVPDGYTLYFSGNQVATAMLKQEAASEVKKIDVRTAFTPIVRMTFQPYVLVVTPALPVRSVKELIAYAKSRPGALNYPSSGSGSASHLSTELFKQMAGVDIVNVPYKGSGQQLFDLMAGQVQMAIVNGFATSPHIKSGKLRALAVTSMRRAQAFPDLPTISEAGVPGFELISWYGLFAPAKAPQPIVTAFNQAVTQIVNAPDMKDRIAVDGSEAFGPNSPEEFKTFFVNEVNKWEKFIRTSGIKLTD